MGIQALIDKLVPLSWFGITGILEASEICTLIFLYQSGTSFFAGAGLSTTSYKDSSILKVKTVNDKIPVLGNLPLIGKLFQSNAESYQKRNLLIFVSASIVSKGGSPVREVIQNIGPQSIFKDPVILTPTGTIRRTFKDDDLVENWFIDKFI